LRQTSFSRLDRLQIDAFHGAQALWERGRGDRSGVTGMTVFSLSLQR
jgi:hypothetical protein